MSIIAQQSGEVADIAHMPRLNSLTGLRFYAALAILLRHAIPPILGLPYLNDFVAVGPIGVGFFFMLSGFVLTWAWKGRSGTIRPLEFYGLRFARIYPLHFVMTCVAVFVSLILALPVHPSGALLSLTLLQSWFPSDYIRGGNSVSWSLSCEMFFYACFPFIINSLARLNSRTAVCSIISILGAMNLCIVAYLAATLIIHRDLTAFSPYTNPGYRIGEFLIGILLARLVQMGVRCPVSFSTALLLCVIVALALGLGNHLYATSSLAIGGTKAIPLFVFDILFAPCAGLLIFAAAWADIERQPTCVGGYRHVLLGQWSFALYLIHYVLIELALAWLPHNTTIWFRVVALLALLLTSIVASWAAYQLLEMPCERVLRAWVRRHLSHA